MLQCIWHGLTACRRQKLKYLKEKPHHTIPCHEFFFFGEGPRSRRYGRTSTLRLLVQPYDEYYYHYILFVLLPVIEHNWNENDKG
jgi:hypothetical protein